MWLMTDHEIFDYEHWINEKCTILLFLIYFQTSAERILKKNVRMLQDALQNGSCWAENCIILYQTNIELSAAKSVDIKVFLQKDKIFSNREK